MGLLKKWKEWAEKDEAMAKKLEEENKREEERTGKKLKGYDLNGVNIWNMVPILGVAKAVYEVVKEKQDSKKGKTDNS